MRAAAIFAFGLVLRLTLIARYPLIFGGDPMGRMLHRNRILVSHHLPLLQLVVAGVTQITTNYVAVMGAMAAIGAAVGVAFYLLARDFFDERVATLAGLMISVEPLVAAHSIVPYQESLMLVCVLLAFHYFYRERYAAASIWLALGCVTRYEAWIAAPVLAAAYIWRGKGVIRGLALFGWAPVAWMIFRGRLAPEGTYVIESSFTPARLIRWVYLGYITAKFTPVMVLALAMVGVWFLWRDREKWIPLMWPLMAFLLAFTVAVLFSAHGLQSDPIRRVASREAHFWMAAVVMLAAVALAKLPRWGTWAAAIGVAFGVWGTWQYVAREALDPRLQLSYQLAKFFDRELKPGERALVLSPPWDRALFDFYLQRARETGGEAGYEAAVRNLAETMDMSPPDYQRMLIHSRFDRSRLLSEAQSCTEWIAVWSDYAAPPADFPPAVNTLTAGSLSVRISKRECGP
jgi:hypothetical protein